MASSSAFCSVSALMAFNTEETEPGLFPALRLASTLCSDVSMASALISSCASFPRNAGSSDREFPVVSISLASRRVRFISRRSSIDEIENRSNSSKYFATDQPSFSLPTRFALGTRTSSKNTWLSSCEPSRLMIGLIFIPGVSISINRNEIPC